MTTYLGKSCSFGLLCVSFVGFVKFCVCPSFPLSIEGRMWDVILVIPDHCLSNYFMVKLRTLYVQCGYRILNMPSNYFDEILSKAFKPIYTNIYFNGFRFIKWTGHS